MAIGVKSLNPLALVSRSRFVRVFGILSIVLAIVVALLPTIVSKTSLSAWLINRATKDLPIAVTAGSVSLGWFSPLIVENVAVADLDGKSLAQIPRIRFERNLFGLLTSRSDLGKITIERATVEVVVTKYGSNIEDLLSKWPKAENKPAATSSKGTRAPSFLMESVDGAVRVLDAEKNKSWSLAKAAISFAHDSASAPPLTGSVVASLTGDGEAGAIDLKIRGDLSKSPKGSLSADLQSMPVAFAGMWLRRSQPDLDCGGRLDGKANAVWLVAADGTPLFQLKANITGKNLEAQGGPIGADHVVVREIQMPLDVEYNGTFLTVARADVHTEFGRILTKGKFAVNRSWYANLSEAGTSISFDLDVAGLAKQMPQTIKIHRDVLLNSGRIAFEGNSVALNNGARWVGRLTTTDIRATRGGAAIAWVDPIALEFKFRQMPQSPPEIDDLKCRSKFLSLEGVGMPKSVKVTAHADLGQLAAQLGQFLDVGAWGLAGRADGAFDLARPDANSLAVNAVATLDQFQWGPWRESRLELKADGKMQTEGDRKTIDKSSSLTVTSGADVLEIKLREPLSIAGAGSTGSIYAKLDGDLARWQQRLKPMAAVLGDMTLQGIAKGEAWVALTPKKVDVQSVVFDAKDLKMTYAGLNMHDPDLKLQFAATYTHDQNAIDLKPSKLTGEAIYLYTEKLKIDLNRSTMAGTVMYGGDLGRVQAWFGPPVAGGDVWTGTFDGKAELLSTAEAFDIDVTGRLRDAAYGTPKTPRFSDPNVRWSAKGNYSGKLGVLSFDKIQLNSQVGVVDAKVRVGKLDATMDLDASGTLVFDLTAVEPWLKSYLGPTARIQGKDRRDFRLAGPLRPKGTAPGSVIEIAALQGNVGFNWQRILAYGAEIGAAEAKGNLQAGWLKFEPIDAAFNQGKLKLSPSLRLDATPQEFALPASPVIENAKITKDMCASALGYLLPALANAATAEGELSLSLDGVRVPLGDATKAEVQGVLVVHHAKVAAGPLITELTGLLKTAAPFGLIRDNQVKFKVDKGRVYHENLELILPDNLTIRTSGSVGFDGSLNMIADMPIPAKLLGVKIPAVLAKTPLRLPITGTIEHPRIDPAALRDLLQRATLEAGGGLIQQGIDNQLKKLFGPKK